MTFCISNSFAKMVSKISSNIFADFSAQWSAHLWSFGHNNKGLYIKNEPYSRKNLVKKAETALLHGFFAPIK